MASKRIVCFGEILLRLTAPRRERLLQTPNLEVCVGGAEANVAVALATFGHAAAMVSVVPANALGTAAVGELRRHGVDVSHVAVGPGRMGLYFLETGATLRPSEVLYDRAASAFALAPPASHDWARLLEGADMLHVSGVTPAVGPNAAAAAIEAVRAARARGLHVVFDGNFRAKLWQAWDGDPRRILAEILDCVDTVFADHRDLGMALGRDFGADPAAAHAAAFARFPQLQRVVATRRIQHHVDDHELSASWITRTGALATPAQRITPIVDRIGAGDAFAAGVLHGLLHGMDDQASLEFGLAAGCLKHSVHADFLRLSAADVAQFLADGRFDVRR
jgi:2-dehydro-3-deoxygluconokinase